VETVRFREKDGSQGPEKSMRVVKGITPQGDFTIFKGYGNEPWHGIPSLRGQEIEVSCHSLENDRSAGVAKLGVTSLVLA
jgi:hypothetical protein